MSKIQLMAFDNFDDALAHYGMPRRSGRYPWGSGEQPYQNSEHFLGYIQDLRKKGFTEAQAAKEMGLKNTAELRALRSIATAEQREAKIQQAIKLRDEGHSNVGIAKAMKTNESTIRGYLNPTLRERNNITRVTADVMAKQIDKYGVVDVGTGVEHYLGISDAKKKVAIAQLELEGYKKFYVPVVQAGTGKETTVMVLAKPGLDFKQVLAMKENIMPVSGYSEDGGRTYREVKPPKSMDSSRIGVRYAEQGGADMDGVIQLRPGVQDLSLGRARYAQVRIAVDGSHYLKGMAMYSDDMPDGVDMVFNTNKSNTGNKLDAMKKLARDPDNEEYIDKSMPFGSMVRQKHYLDGSGKEQLSPLNIVGSHDSVNEEGRWNQWSRNFSSQLLGKQSPQLAQKLLNETYRLKAEELDEIMQLNNPVVKRKLLEEFADGADASAVHLKAASLPRTRSQVLLPINSLKDNEIYAPNFNDGETVALVRHPHAGPFEIPVLKVNNRNKEALAAIPQAKDAVGINARVAKQLSGADFDGDTVLVIPNNRGEIKSAKTLPGLVDFDPQQYKIPEGSKIKPMKGLQVKMGDVSNLITDMSVQGASDDEITRAVKHSMVVIDAVKHKLNHKQSALDNNIIDLKKKYQKKDEDGKFGGAATLLSRSKSTARPLERTPRKAQDGGPINPNTGEKMWTYSGEVYEKQTLNKETGEVVTVKVPRQSRETSTRMAETNDALTLVSANGGTVIERVYANHANRLKSLANQARKATLSVGKIEQSRSAKETYAAEAASLREKLLRAEKNAPLERRAQILAELRVDATLKARPDMEKDQIKKLKGNALVEARARTGAAKERVVITDREWEAIQAGAISDSRLDKLLNNADMDRVRELATPRARKEMTAGKVAMAQSMADRGYTASQIADRLGFSVSTIHDALTQD